MLASFMLDFHVVLQQMEPPAFRWGLFGTGIALWLAALTLVLRARP